MLSGMIDAFIFGIDLFAGLIGSGISTGMAAAAGTSAYNADAKMGTGHGITSVEMPVRKNQITASLFPVLRIMSRHRERASAGSEGKISPQADHREMIPSESTKTAGNHLL